MNNERWSGSTEKILTIFIIVLAFHLAVILLIGFLNVWKTSSIMSDNGTNNSAAPMESAVTDNALPVQQEEENLFENWQEAHTTSEESIIAEDEAIPVPQSQEFHQVPDKNIPELASLEASNKPNLKEDIISYTVVPGDTLSGISRKTGISLDKLRKANHIKDDFLIAGQTLNIPEKRKSIVSLNNSVSESPPMPLDPPILVPDSSVKFSSYLVKNNDTLNKIARNHKTTAEKLAKLNGMSDPSKLKPGDRIKIPINDRK